MRKKENFTVVDNRMFTMNVCIFFDIDGGYTVQTEDDKLHRYIMDVMEKRNIPIMATREGLNNNKIFKYFITIKRRSDVKKLINALLNDNLLYLHIDI